MELTLGWRFGDKQYLECKFSDETHEVGMEVSLDTRLISSILGLQCKVMGDQQ